MIVPMKKVSVLVLENEKNSSLHELRRLGVIHIETVHGSGEHLTELKEQVACIEHALLTIAETKNKKEKAEPLETRREEAMTIAQRIAVLDEEKKNCRSRITAVQAQLEQLKKWGEFDPADLAELAKKGVSISLHELPTKEYQQLGEKVTTLLIAQEKRTVRFAVLDGEDALPVNSGKVTLPGESTYRLREELEESKQRIASIDDEIISYDCRIEGMKQCISSIEKEIEFENYSSGMAGSALSEQTSIVYLNGYIPAEDLDKLKQTAQTHAWGVVAEDPAVGDNVPTKLRNNKLVSLIYPLTDFLGTVPGYFEYDISGWFLAFVLIFFGIIFGDGGYGLLITGVAAVLIGKTLAAKKKVPPLYLLVAMFGGATVVWGLLTCTWFGIAPEQLPQWLTKISLAPISNVNESRIWYPFWTNGAAGLTTAQNLQIFCFSLALIQLSVAHIKGIVRSRHSLKFLGELGSLFQIWGIFYVVLTLVVNSEVFGLDLVISGIPVGTIAIVLVAVGFIIKFIFDSYNGSIKNSILDSVKNIVSILLGVVNVFSDIVSYIRLWAVGLAGAAISATVNEIAGPLFGRITLLVFVVILLVFGHGLNMILNLLSVIVHGVRLNTLEFSTHLGMSWSGYKYEPFKE